jgi:hypothetical protein
MKKKGIVIDFSKLSVILRSFYNVGVFRFRIILPESPVKR